MIYYALRFYCKVLLKLYVKELKINGLEKVPKSGPVLFTINHFNSFLEAILLECQFKRPTWALARGDAFKNKKLGDFLSTLFLIPIYRLSEGKEHMHKNDYTMDKCVKVFEQGDQILIFPEGICLNQTELLPLKKGAARMAQKTWEKKIDLIVQPVGVSYDQYHKFGKKMVMNFGETIVQYDIENSLTEAQFLKEFNENLFPKMSNLITRDIKGKTNYIYYLGWLVNFPAYFFIDFIAKKKTKGTVFYDSIVFVLLMFLLPIYWLMIFGVCSFGF